MSERADLDLVCIGADGGGPRRSIRNHDEQSIMFSGCKAWTDLPRRSMALFGNNPAVKPAGAHDVMPTGFIEIGPAAYSNAKLEHPVCLGVAGKSPVAISELIETVRDRGTSRVAPLGGMASTVTPDMAAALTACFVEPLAGGPRRPGRVLDGPA